MKISYNWLKQFIKTDWEAEKTGELLTSLGLEVEGISTFESVKGGLKGVVVGKVLTCEKHPNADRLKITSVDIGLKEPLKIVCGAQNVAVNQKVAVATIGTELFNASGESIVIKKGNIRGEASEGMICAEDELGLGNSHDGIMVLSPDVEIGTPLSIIFEVETDQVFEIGLTPNRADAMSHWGVARDLKAGLLQTEKKIEIITPSNANFRVDNRTQKIDVEVVDKKLAPRYCGVTISGITVNDSPIWIQNRLKAIGINPKNNIVDITNYVLHELGQPLHAFDCNKIEGNKIIVKTVSKGTKFTTLDEIERELHEEDLMICDTEKPLCIAGVFGGLSSGVTQNTTSIFLESAYFDPVSIRKTAKRHGLSTDASFRFERGIDPNITEYALMRAAQLIKETAGGNITSDVSDFYPKKIEDAQVVFSYEKGTRIIGAEIPKEAIKNILASLEIKVTSVTEAGLGLLVPAYRNDVTRDIDIIEEILRVYGYNNIDFTEKLNASISKTSKIEDYKIQNKIADMLTDFGFYEMMANSLSSSKHNAIEQLIDQNTQIKMMNPLSQDLSVMRQDMVISALEAISYNLNRKKNDIKLFEFGKTYYKKDNAFIEDKHLSIIISGNKTKNNWNQPSQKSDFFYLKGIIDSVLERLGLQTNSDVNEIDTVFSEGISYRSNTKKVVSFGIIDKRFTKHFDIDNEVLYACFNWDYVLQLLESNNFIFKEISKYPVVKRDFALLLDENISFQQVYKTAFATDSKLLKDLNLFDVYQGKNLPEGKKSYAVSFTIADDNKTLTDKQVDKLMKQLQLGFEKELGAALR